MNNLDNVLNSSDYFEIIRMGIIFSNIQMLTMVIDILSSNLNLNIFSIGLNVLNKILKIYKPIYFKNVSIYIKLCKFLLVSKVFSFDHIVKINSKMYEKKIKDKYDAIFTFLEEYKELDIISYNILIKIKNNQQVSLIKTKLIEDNKIYIASFL